MRRGAIAGIAGIVVLAGGVTAWAVQRDDDPAATGPAVATGASVRPTPGTSAGSAVSDPAGASGAPGMERPGPADVVTYTAHPVYQPIAGSDVQAVVAAWNKHWKITLKKDSDEVYSAFVDFPATGSDLQLIVRQPAQGPSGPAVSVRCAWEHRPGSVTRAVITAIVDECLAPALRPGQRKPVLDWLVKQNYRGHRQVQQRFDRFEVLIEELGGATRISLVGHV